MKVSVFMSVYNGMPYIIEAVNSILNQTATDFELFIVNDGSTDNTREYLDKINDNRVKVVHQKNQGLGKPLNKWMKQCKGEYIMRADADDISNLDRIEKQADYLDKHIDTVLVGCQYQVFTNIGKGHISTLPMDDHSIVSGMLNGWHTISHATIMFRKSLLNNIDGYTFSGPGEDWSLLLGAANYGKLAVLPDILYNVRLHHNSNSWKGATGTIAGLVYAQKQYSLKEKGIEYSDKEFLQEWSNRSPLKRLLTQLKTISAQLYREATLNKIEKKYLKYYAQLTIASLFDLNKTTGAIYKKINRRTNK